MHSGSCLQVAALGARLHVVEDELRSARAQLRERAVADRADLSKIEVAQAERDEWQRQIDEARREHTTTRSCGLHATDGCCLAQARAHAGAQREMVELLESRLAASRAAEAAWFEERRAMHLEVMRVKHQV